MVKTITQEKVNSSAFVESSTPERKDAATPAASVGSYWSRRKLDPKVLVEEREKHQTEAAEKGVRTRDSTAQQDSNNSLSLQHQLNRRLQEALQAQEQGITTGLGRRVHHNMPTPEVNKKGNAANAAIVAEITSTKVWCCELVFFSR